MDTFFTFTRSLKAEERMREAQEQKLQVMRQGFRAGRASVSAAAVVSSARLSPGNDRSSNCFACGRQAFRSSDEVGTACRVAMKPDLPVSMYSYDVYIYRYTIHQSLRLTQNTSTMNLQGSGQASGFELMHAGRSPFQALGGRPFWFEDLFRSRSKES